MDSFQTKPQRILTNLVLWAILLLAWTARAHPSYASEPRVWATPTAASVQPGRTVPPSDWSPEVRGKVEPALLKQVLAGAPGDQFRFVVELNRQADLVPLPADLAGADRQHLVVSRLQATAQDTQAALLAFLLEQQTRGQVEEVRPFWIFNGLAVTADASTVLALASRPEVRIVREDRWRRWVEPLNVEESQSPLAENEVEWSIARVRADLAWSALDLDGSGVTVAIMDTGVDWQHPALQGQYRGYKPGGLSIHQGNWLCTTDEGYVYPVDGHGHGTHVAGTAVGSRDTAGRAIGMAPGARWIAVKALSDAGYGYDSWLHAAFEWLLAPGGDPALAPDIVNGSWGKPDDEDETFRADLEALRAAGIVAVFAAGNSGPRAASLDSPGSYPEVLTVGATDDLDQVTSFSSRGPSPWDEIKPEVVAPGVQIRSTLPGGSFGVAGGTSMAVPHVTGLAALLLQADPSLSVDQLEAIITSTALPLGDEIPNNDAGWGRIDAYRAAAVAMQAGFVAGQVARHPDQLPLTTAQITAYNHVGDVQATVQVDHTGRYQVALPEGRYTLEAKAFGYDPHTANDVLVQAALTTTLDIQLFPSPAGVLWGQVRHAETNGPVGAEISVHGTPSATTSDPQTGQYSLALPAGTYDVQVSQNGYRRSTSQDVQIAVDEATRLDFALTPAPTLVLVDSGRWYYGSQASYVEQALEDRNYVYDLWEIRDLETDRPSVDDLARYEITVWSSPLDAPGLIGAGDTISNYLSIGGNLLLTGQDIGYWDDGLSGFTWHEYYRRFLKAEALVDDAGRDNLVGVPGDILEGLSLAINGPDSAENQFAPDAISLLEPRRATIVGRYGDSADAALRVSGCQSYRAVYLAAGLEGLGDQSTRAEVMDRTLSWLATPHPEVAVDLDPPKMENVWVQGTSITYTVELLNGGSATDRFALELSTPAWPSSVWDGSFTKEITRSMALGACQTQTLGIRVTVPPQVSWNLTDVVTLTARSETDPAHTAQAVFHSKAPAPILLVDGHRWYDVADRYRAALDANRLPYDVWVIDASRLNQMPSVGLERLHRYPVVIWFTAYDWYRTLTPQDESDLSAYLNYGGRLLLSSQDYLYTSGGPTDFARQYLGVASHTETLTATQVLGSVSSPIGSGFGPYELEYPFLNWSDSLKPDPRAQTAFWGQHAQPVALTLAQTPWKTAFFAFPLESLQEPDMAAVLGRAVDWLSPLGDSTLTVDRPVAADGDQLAYTLVIRNTGPVILSNVTLSNTIAPSTTYVTGSLEGPAEYDPGAKRFTWQGTLDPDQAITIRYLLQLATDLADGSAVQNVAHLAEESGLGIERIATTRIDTPDLTDSVKTVSDREAMRGQVLTYTISLRNDGLQPAQAQLADPLPLYTTALPDLSWASSGLLTSTTAGLWWTGSLATGGAVTITFPVVISSSADGLFVLNRAIVTDGWTAAHPLEAYTWVQTRLFLPLVLKAH